MIRVRAREPRSQGVAHGLLALPIGRQLARMIDVAKAAARKCVQGNVGAGAGEREGVARGREGALGVGGHPRAGLALGTDGQG